MVITGMKVAISVGILAALVAAYMLVSNLFFDKNYAYEIIGVGV